MKKLFLALSLLILPLTVYGQPGPGFSIKLTDAYFQSGVSKPYHLIHTTTDNILVKGDAPIRIWHSILMEGDICIKNSCLETLRLIEVNYSNPGPLSGNLLLYKDAIKLSSTPDTLDVNIAFQLDAIGTPPRGEALLVYTIEDEGKVILRYQIPIKIE